MSLRSAFLAFFALPLLGLASPALAQDAQHASSHEISLGQLLISGPFTRATLPNAPVGGGFLTITNAGTEDDRLISAESGMAKMTQIHEMAMEGDVMKMRQLADGVVIPAGQTIALEPGGLHLMFMGLSGPIVEGETVPVTLNFEKAGTITLDLVAAGSAADAPAGDHGAMKH